MPLPDPGPWPAGVDWRPRRATFAEQPYQAVRETKMEAGNTHREALDSDLVVSCTVMWRFTPAEWREVMRPFFVARRATGWSGNWVNAGGGISAGLITVEGGPPNAVQRGARVEVTAKLEIIPDEEPAGE